MTRYILRRRFKKKGDMFLSEKYKWTLMPHSFSEVEFTVVFPEAMNYRDRPQHVGEITGGDLDRVVWKEV
jgi:hypothetical protein